MIKLSQLTLAELERLRRNIKIRISQCSSTYDSQFRNFQEQQRLVEEEMDKRYTKYRIIELENNKGLLNKNNTQSKIEQFKDELKQKSKEEINKGFEEFKQATLTIDKSMLPDNYYEIISSSISERNKELNVDKIQSLDDVKRVLKFLKITAVDNGIIRSNGFEEVRDLFD